MITIIKKIFRSATKNTFRKILTIILIAFPVYNLILLNYHHEFRVSVNKIIENDDREFFENDPETLKEKIKWEDRSLIKDFEYPIPDSIANEEKSLEQVMNIMTVIGKLYSERELINKNIPESPESIRDFFFQKNYRGSCYNDAILLSTLMQRESYFTRIIGLNGNDGLGGTGHNIVEVWLDSLNKWIALDPQNNVCFREKGGDLLSVLELRDAVISSNNVGAFLNKIDVIQFVDNPHLVNYIFKLYKPLIGDINFYSNNDFYTESETSIFRKLSNIIEKQFELFGVYAIWSGRWIRSVFGTQIIIFRYIDENNKESYNPNLFFIIYRIFYWIWIISVFLMIIIFVNFIIKRSLKNKIC